jgi:hypothetical protein
MTRAVALAFAIVIDPALGQNLTCETRANGSRSSPYVDRRWLPRHLDIDRTYF